MNRRLIGAVSLAALSGLLFCQTAGAQQESKDAARALAERIDKLIEARWAEAKIKPLPLVDDAQFLRRLSLDLNGRIPKHLDVQDILSRDEPNRRELYVDLLLDGKAQVVGSIEDRPEYRLMYTRNFGNFWRALFLSETNNAQFQQQGFQRGFEQWIQQRIQSNVGYDKMVHELISGIGTGGVGNGPGLLIQANENKPENMAGNTARIFLGVKLACAQCHKHPFASWTKNQFWEYAAFFAGIQPRGGKQPVNPNDREIRIPETDKTAKAKFITGVEPEWKAGVPTRTVLADWVTAADNPYFARAAVDHLWQYFFGVSLLEPILEPNDDNPVTYPELLDELAKEFVAKQFDIKYLIRSIVLTKAYQRSSQGGTGEREEVLYFARMPVRGMSPEQLFDSFAQATNWNDPYESQMVNQNQPGFQQTPRAQFLARFTSQDKRMETQTSILQALFLMNSKFVAERTESRDGSDLDTIARNAKGGHPQRVQSLYWMVLSRPPRPEETTRLVNYLEGGGPTGNLRDALADIYWALLNSGEFMLNH